MDHPFTSKAPPGLDLDFIQYDFAEGFELDPEPTLEALHLLLIDPVNCAGRVAWLRGLQDAALRRGRAAVPVTAENFEPELKLIRDAELFPAFQSGVLSASRLGRLACSPDSLWAAHCELIRCDSELADISIEPKFKATNDSPKWSEVEPVRLAAESPQKRDLIRLSRVFHLPAIASARSLSHPEDFRQEITIAGCPAIAEVLDLDDQWLVRVQTRHAEVSEVTLVVRLVETDESASGDASVSSLQVVEDFDNEDAASRGWPIALKGTSDRWFVGSVTVSADEVAREIHGRSFSVVLLVAQAEQRESGGLSVEPTDEEPGQSVGNELGFTPGWTDKVELARLLGKTAAVSQETRASAGETVPAGVGAAGKVTAFDANSQPLVVLLIDPLPWVVMWGMDADGAAVASRRDWESNVRTLCERAARKLSSRSTSEMQTSQREELVHAVEEAATEAGLEWRRRIDTDEDWDAFALQTVVGVVLSQAAPREFEWERHFREWLLEQRIQTADDLRRMEFPDTSIPAQDLVAAQTRWYEQVRAGLKVLSVGKPSVRQEV